MTTANNAALRATFESILAEMAEIDPAATRRFVRGIAARAAIARGTATEDDILDFKLDRAESCEYLLETALLEHCDSAAAFTVSFEERDLAPLTLRIVRAPLVAAIGVVEAGVDAARVVLSDRRERDRDAARAAARQLGFYVSFDRSNNEAEHTFVIGEDGELIDGETDWCSHAYAAALHASKEL